MVRVSVEQRNPVGLTMEQLNYSRKRYRMIGKRSFGDRIYATVQARKAYCPLAWLTAICPH